MPPSRGNVVFDDTIITSTLDRDKKNLKANFTSKNTTYFGNCCYFISALNYTKSPTPAQAAENLPYFYDGSFAVRFRWGDVGQSVGGVFEETLEGGEHEPRSVMRDDLRTDSDASKLVRVASVVAA